MSDHRSLLVFVNGHAVGVADGWFLAAPVGLSFDDEFVGGGGEPVDGGQVYLYSACGNPAWSVLGCCGRVSMTEAAACDGCLLAGGCEHRVREL
jgi:hypothetical protein